MLPSIFEKHRIKVNFFTKSPLTAQFQPLFLTRGEEISEKKDEKARIQKKNKAKVKS